MTLPISSAHEPTAPELATVQVPHAWLDRVPREFAVRHRLLPILERRGGLVIAMADPDDTDARDAVEFRLGMPADAVAAPAEEIAAAIDRCYGKTPTALDEWGRDASADGAASRLVRSDDSRPGSENVTVGDEDAPIIQLVHRILADAIRRGASDIHLEPLEKRFRVRYRIDGVLLEVENPPKRLQLAIVSRLKIMAHISIAEKRMPQDGRIRTIVDGRALDLRVSSLPTTHGESIVMRILDQRSVRLGLAELGFLPEDAAAFEKAIALPDGIVLVTGPTGSGKTTTLYGCLHHLNQPDRKIITVEDPVEYQLAGINQVPVRPEIGMTFASALRAMLRQAPNVVMVGEIRDLETAEIAINASLTGHMVFSTLHTNDAPGAVTRLIDLGVKPFLVATSLRAVVAQRLVRKVCVACRRPHRPEPWELRGLGLDPATADAGGFAKGAGCAACDGTGYRGRMGIFELMVFDDELQRMIHGGAGTAALREKACALGMRTTREDGARKASAGLTTIEEVVSIT